MTIEVERVPVIENPPDKAAAATRLENPNWVENAQIVWNQRRLIARVSLVAFLMSIAIAFLIPKTYESTTRIMPPENSGSGATLLAALTRRALGGDALGGLAASLLGGRNTGALFTDLLRSGTVTGRLIDRFDLQSVYRKRYREDAAKSLLRHTQVLQDKRSGVITVTVKDHDPKRARDLAQAYLEELNQIVNRTSTSSAHQERLFIEARLAGVKVDLDKAQKSLSEFSSTHATIDLREQTRATVEGAAKLEGELIATQGELESLRQIYGDGNVRVHAAEARIANLKKEVMKIGGTSAQLPLDHDGSSQHNGEQTSETYPPLRQLPRLAVPYSDLYRSVRTQETVFELLTQQYEIARIQEAKDIPAVNVIDPPGIPEKKSFPPRALLILGLTATSSIVTCMIVIALHHWNRVDTEDSRRVLAREIFAAIRTIRYHPRGMEGSQ